MTMSAVADQRTSVTMHERTVPVEIFRPTAEGRAPGLLVIHEIFGVNDDIRRIARRFATAGYVAAAPDLLASGLRLRCIVEAMRALQTGAGPMVEALESVIAMLEARPEVTRVGAVGFCMGGGFALLLGTRQRLSAAGVFYGDSRPRAELARVCPLTGGFGGLDRIFAPKGRALIADLEALGKEHDIRIYEDAGHSYMSQTDHPVLAWLSRPLMHVEYNAAAAEDSWRRMLAFFERHLRSPSPS